MTSIYTFQNMKVFTASDKAKKSRELVFELLLTDQPKKEEAHDPNSHFWDWIDKIETKKSRFPKKIACKKYAGTNIAGLAKRSTFVIGIDGVIHDVMREINVTSHGQEILASLNKIKV